MAVQDYRQLEVWQEAMNLVELVYKHSQDFPKEEMFGLRIQLRRAAVSVPSNIAEGSGRRSTREFLHQLSVSRGSLLEIQTQLEIASRLHYLTREQTVDLDQRLITVVRLLNGLMNALEKKIEG
jgi:four helix bundle protein